MQKPETLTDALVRERLTPLVSRLAAPDPILARLPDGVAVFCVGGAVRDALLGEPNSDRDYVVVGASVDDMLAAGFAPVGKDFPVFLHPTTHEEFALARTERKSGQGYKGFVFQADPSVRLEDDLLRRDLTINAIALSAAGEVVDPHHGLQDLQERLLRHVGPAFSEDPVRLLRLARFAARWPDFSIASKTTALCRDIVASGETGALVAERVWQEIAKGLMETKPSRMMRVLMETQAWFELGPKVSALSDTTLQQIDQAAADQAPLEVRYALLIGNQGGSAALSEQLFKAPKSCQELAALFIQQSRSLEGLMTALDRQPNPRAEIVLDWLMSADAQRRPERFNLLLACLQLSQRIDGRTADLLAALAAHISTASANESVAKAVEQAKAQGLAIAEAARTGRLAILLTHPAMQPPKR